MSTASEGHGASSVGPAAPTISLATRYAMRPLLIAFALSFTFVPYANISAFMLHRQDRWLLLLATAILVLASRDLRERPSLPQIGPRTWLIATLVLAIVTYAGHFWVLNGYDLSRDEQMASFDSKVFSTGHIVAHLPRLWVDHADALNTKFIYPAMHRGAWISSYLPFNAALRALLALVGAPYLVGSLMTALGALALWGCVHRLWPGDREAGFVALMLYAGSAQVLFAGMTSYAMPGHLALNLVWLWLYLRRALWSDLAALAIGFVASGLHQQLLHPMFVAPFLLLLLFERRWDRAALYLVGYAAICAFWALWPEWIWSLVQSSPDAMRPAGIDLVTHVRAMVSAQRSLGLANIIAALLRFIAWQPLLLVPLALVGASQYRKATLIVALGGGMVLTLLVMLALLPFQGHGFGYRYFHGFIGNAILLAIYGWKSLGSEAGQWRTLLLRTISAGFLVLMPLQAWMTHTLYTASATSSARIDQVNADYAIIGGVDAPFAVDLVYNPPMLDRRPVRLLREALDARAITAICATHPTIALVGNTLLAPLVDYFAPGQAPTDRFNPTFAPRLAAAGCRVNWTR